MRRLLPLFLFVLLLTGQGCGSANQAINTPTALEIWGVFDSERNYAEVIEAYRLLHPNVSIDFREFRADEYETELVRALAEGTGPDIFLVHNDSMREFQSLMMPMPETVTIAYQEVRGTVKKEIVNVLRTEQTISMRSFADKFVDVVEDDAILGYQPDPKIAPEDRIYGLPTGLDTLALYWNKDLLNAAGIATAPTTWTEFQEAVTALTKIDTAGTITNSGAGIGTSENVERAVDILALLMMQNGTVMADDRGRATFNEVPEGLSRAELPGLDATRFYTDFANPTKAVYTWNASRPNSFDAFVNGTSAMYFGYAYSLPLIRTAAPKLNFAISEIPQIEAGREVNFANYWLMAVSKDSADYNYAWDFIQFLTTEEEQNAKYLAAAGKPPALRGLIASQLEDEDLAPFASQVLTAKSWYRGSDATAAESALLQLIDDILEGVIDPGDAIDQAASKVNQTL
jgi:ABC-type glycerol-3-phosphate transport system substrate-binding protein